METGTGELGDDRRRATLVPSGLFPVGPPRPTYREPHPVRLSGLASGLLAGVAWLTLFAQFGTDPAGHLWGVWVGGLLAWLAALLLAHYGDRGAAVGVAVATGMGWSVTTELVWVLWVVTDDWPLW